jgi:hypothetical protein
MQEMEGEEMEPLLPVTVINIIASPMLHLHKGKSNGCDGTIGHAA